MRNIFAGKIGILVAGGLIGLAAAFLQYAGNPANMGICVACFLRDIAGSLGLHRAAPVEYMRPEIPAFVLGSLGAALFSGEFRARAGSAPATRFFLGMCAMAGALVFLGCPWRAILRLAGGDGNALFGIAGLCVGVFIGTRFFKAGFSLGRAQQQNNTAGIMLALCCSCCCSSCAWFTRRRRLPLPPLPQPLEPFLLLPRFRPPRPALAGCCIP